MSLSEAKAGVWLVVITNTPTVIRTIAAAAHAPRTAQTRSGDPRAAATSMLGVSLFRGATPKKVKRNRKHVAYL